MPLADWIHKYPQVQALLQADTDELEYVPDGESDRLMQATIAGERAGVWNAVGVPLPYVEREVPDMAACADAQAVWMQARQEGTEAVRRCAARSPHGRRCTDVAAPDSPWCPAHADTQALPEDVMDLAEAVAWCRRSGVDRQ